MSASGRTRQSDESTPARTKREWRARNGEPARTNWHRAETNRRREPDETCPFKTHYTDHNRSHFMSTATIIANDVYEGS